MTANNTTNNLTINNNNIKEVIGMNINNKIEEVKRNARVFGEEVTQDYTLYERIVASLNLSENMRIALECRQNGISYPEIGRVLSRAQATVYEYFIKMRQRYSNALQERRKILHICNRPPEHLKRSEY